jgi:hypothetical protein
MGTDIDASKVGVAVNGGVVTLRDHVPCTPISGSRIRR